MEWLLRVGSGSGRIMALAQSCHIKGVKKKNTNLSKFDRVLHVPPLGLDIYGLN